MAWNRQSKGSRWKRAMDPVLSQIGEDEDPRELTTKGCPATQALHLRVGRPLEQHHRRLEGEQRRHLDEERAGRRNRRDRCAIRRGKTGCSRRAKRRSRGMKSASSRR